VQVKRLHEYKRQLMNALGVLVRRNRLKRDPAWRDRAVPRAVLFAGKAAPGYAAAKLILRCLCRVADLVNGDPEMKGRLAAAFLPNYSVGMAEKLIPPADLSEQISTAGCEASGTGNMKFAMNGALTVGTLDGANIEIRDAVGHEHFFLFGKTAEEIAELEAWETAPDGSRRRRYDPAAVLHAHPEIAEAVGMLADGTLTPEEPGAFRPLYDALTVYGDRYFVLADLPAYLEAQDRVDAHYRDAAKWNVSAARNIAGMGWFSSDRAVSGYAREIWNLKPSF
ncbi:MAG TPA: glycogen/starch/alpha-glucan phosphorylase, partial [Planctomycetota bacterium]|nr:glycogen/starch/alpha-glucan phosphorylase [Planctomycetota bacterium]